MSLLYWLCYFLERTHIPKIELEDGYFFFDEDTGDIHKI